jgi:hypothetical protein
LASQEKAQKYFCILSIFDEEKAEKYRKDTAGEVMQEVR